MGCRRYRVSGRVQGVFYRASARDEARRRGLRGWVRNCADGGVELLACGPEPELEGLQAWLWQGPPAAQVENVVSEDAAVREVPNGFEVRYE